MRGFLIVFVICFSFTSIIESAEISVTDIQGRTMQVEVISYTKSSGNVRIKRTEDGQFFNVKIGVFDGPSQDAIVANAPKAKAELLIKVSVGKRRKDQANSSYMKDQTISASFTVENDSRDIDFPEGEATLFLIGRQTRRYSEDGEDYGKILSKQKFKVAANAGEEKEYEAKQVVTSYDSDRDYSNVGGYEYFGYLLVLKDDENLVHTVETSIGALKKDVEENPAMGEKLSQLAEGALVEKDLKKR